MLSEYENLRIEIKKLDDNKKYDLSLLCIKSYLEKVNKNSKDDTREDLWFGYYALARCLSKTGANAKEVIGNLKKSIKYYTEDGEYMKSLWMLARYYRIYFKNYNDDKVIRIYNRCEHYYKTINNELLLAMVLNNKAFILHDEKIMNESVNLYKKLYSLNLVDREDLEDTYRSLCKIYIYNREYKKAKGVLHSITNTKFKEELEELLNSQTHYHLKVVGV